MAHDWIIAQLDAMVAYAARNDLPAIRDALSDARLVALTEIASRDAGDEPPLGGTPPTDGCMSYH
ncbi:MAG: hypothetical protein ACK4HW_13120 [Roseinatronobacter sp.]